MKAPFQLIKAEQQHVDAMLQIISDAQELLKSNHIDQWQNGYPNSTQLLKDIASGDSYVVLKNNTQVVATVFLTFEKEPTYNQIHNGNWRTPVNQPYGTIHRLAVRASERGSGIAKMLITECEQKLKSKGIHSLKIDTHADNKGMQALITQLEYQYCGEIYLEDGALRLAFEKIIA